MDRYTNILDPIHDTLDERVFDNVESERPKLKPQHRDWVRDTIVETLEAHGYTNVEEWLKLVFTGSLTTYQYSEESDFDVSLFVDTEVFPEWSRAEMIGIMIDNIDGTFLPGTPFVMQAFVVPPDRKPEDLYKPGLRSGYDLDADDWVVPPEKGRVRDVQKEMNRAYVAALESADKMERLLRYEPDKAVTYWHQIHNRRRRDHGAGKGDYSDSNIVYKFLANRGLFPQISEVSGEYIAHTGARVYEDWEPSEAYDQAQAGWEPETEGKGLYNQSTGRLYTWTTSDFGGPHHEEVWSGLTEYGDEQQEFGYEVYAFEIDSDGSFSVPTPELGRAIESKDQRLHYVPEEIGGGLFGFNSGYERSWALDGLAVRRAQEELGITKPVEVKVVDGTHGYYTDMGDHHEVGVVGWLRPESASTQLWHELQHAKQVETSGPLPERPSPFEEYRAMPTEQDAREVAQNAAYPLVHPLKQAGPDKKRNTLVKKWVYNGAADELVIGELGPEEGLLPSHNQLAQELSTNDPMSLVFGTISASGWATFEGGSGDHDSRVRAQQAIKRAIPNLKGWLGGSLDRNPWDFST